MFKRLILIGLLGIGAVAMSGTHANAQFFDGWGWFGFSSLEGFVDLKKVKNPLSQPSVVIAEVISTNIQIACKNPANNGISPGNSFTAELTDFNSVNPGSVTTKGDAQVPFVFPLDQFEVNTNCQNPNWHPIVNSAMLLSFTVHLDWFKCTGQDLAGDEFGNNDDDPCTETVNGEVFFTINQTARGLLDTADISCTLDTATYPRDPITGEAPHGAILTCPEV